MWTKNHTGPLAFERQAPLFLRFEFISHGSRILGLQSHPPAALSWDQRVVLQPCGQLQILSQLCEETLGLGYWRLSKNIDKKHVKVATCGNVVTCNGSLSWTTKYKIKSPQSLGFLSVVLNYYDSCPLKLWSHKFKPHSPLKNLFRACQIKRVTRRAVKWKCACCELRYCSHWTMWETSMQCRCNDDMPIHA